MVKKQKIDESGDSDDLQALFDSIAGGADPAPPPVAPPVSAGKAEAAGDNDELQALFDSVAQTFEEAVQTEADQPAGASAQAPAGAAEAASAAQNQVVFNRIGQMTRQVHDTLRALGADSALQEAVQAMPDARQRLSYIAQMTEQAASRVLNATDIAKPVQDRLSSDATALQAKWQKLFDNELSMDDFKKLTRETHGFLGQVAEGSKATSDQLLDIMMAQDFQDLTGQVIKKVVDLAQTLESELLQVLLEVTPADKRVQKAEGLMNGPVINATDRDDVVTTQEQVDDLLDSLGF